MSYETTIGLEIHVQLKTKSKMFCGCDNYSGVKEPNINICPVCAGYPGVLPVINKEAVLWTIKTGLALNCQILPLSKFDRKNYFYPDLPKGYQISQYDLPLCQNGYLEITVGEKENSYLKKVRITRIHLEEDAGKLIHPEGKDYSLVDLNRAGTPLMEIVTEPDLSTPDEAKVFMQELRAILRYLGVSEANMEEGNLRCDANISIKKRGEKSLGVKVEIKNMNSFRAVERALAYEQDRQTEILREGNKIIQETRGWDEKEGKTIPQRTKEESADYRYFPDPDLPPLDLTDKNFIDLEVIKSSLPELPNEKQARFQREYGLSSYDANILTLEPEIAYFFEKSVEKILEYLDSSTSKQIIKKVSNWITVELLGRLNARGLSVSQCKIKPQDLAQLIFLIEKGEISGKMAKGIFDEMLEKGKNPELLMKEKNLKQISDESELTKIVEEVIKENPSCLADYQKGKTQALGFLVGQVMKKTKGQANPQLVNKILQERLKSYKP